MRKKKGLGRFILLIGLILLAFSLWKGIQEWLPNQQYANQDGEVAQRIAWNDQLTSYGASGSGKSLLIPAEAIEEYMGSYVWVEKQSNLVVITNETDTAVIPIDGKKGYWNGERHTWDGEAKLINGEAYVPASALEELGVATSTQFKTDGRVELVAPGSSYQQGKIKLQKKPDLKVALRQEADKQSLLVGELFGETELKIWEQAGNWLKVTDQISGAVGFVKESEVEQGAAVQAPAKKQLEAPEFVRQKTPVNLTWEAVYTRNPKTSNLPDMPGVNVISPTWFSLADPVGNVNSKADSSIVEWAHGKGKQVWALYSNSFDPDLTKEALSTYERRSRSTQQLIDYARQYNLDGINIDFENVKVDERDALTQWVREASPLLHLEGLVVSIDVTGKSSSGNWSMFLDRENLAKSVDYMMVMAYDEHWAASPKAGSVASLPWTEQTMRRIMEEDNVPASKLVLGMPLYMRIWTETEAGGKTEVKSKAVGMTGIKEWLQEHKVTPQFLEDVGQHYAEVTVNGERLRVWIEDETSIQARIDMAKRMELAGVATWARTFGDESLWDMLHY
ncbi:glycosyl hydrolase family 18 protein [Paenibacillus sp. 1001270B_150601_E10]|uniref:glycosyl hydrolase family 18 protein n=1 Tax=Paenibacillus sp. 1001270B_150601_E10 TaxID=2787079 RepID=UPI002B4BE969|nr:glycosyl hydrolase family 18 protein [Paenibacillus sp. 1001270B_150601_E10]